MDKYFSTHQVAQMCQVSRGSVIRWIHEGKLVAAKTAGGHRRIWWQDLVKFMKELKMIVPRELIQIGVAEDTTRILIVDDEIEVIQLLRIFLRKYFPQCEVYEAKEGFEAGLMISKVHPDLILLDLVLPQVDGFELCKKIRSQADLASIKIIAISGLQEGKTQERILQLGADDFLSKPFSLDVLKEKILKQLGQIEKSSQVQEKRAS